MKTIRKNMATLGLNPTREYTILIVFIALFFAGGAAFAIWKGNYILLTVPAGLSVIFTYAFFARYSWRIGRQKRIEEEEFIRLFTYFQVYLNDGYNIYNALSSIIPFASPTMRMKLERLLQDIDSDKSITPFVEFGNTFDDIQVRQVMLSIYQMVDQGTSESYLQQFRHIFGRLSDQKHALYKQKRIEKVANLSILPLVGSGVSMMMLLAALMEIMEGVANGF